MKHDLLISKSIQNDLDSSSFKSLNGSEELNFMDSEMEDNENRLYAFFRKFYIAMQQMRIKKQAIENHDDIIKESLWNDILRYSLKSALLIPSYVFSRDADGNKGIPIIFSLIEVNIPDSDALIDSSIAHIATTKFKIELCYGNTFHWTVYHRFIDFVKLHWTLKIKSIKGKLPGMPKFPSQMKYFQKAFSKNLEKDDRIAMAAQRREFLRNYLKSLLNCLNMIICTELCEFLEISGLSFYLGFDRKGKEGYAEKVSQSSSYLLNLPCIPMKHSKKYSTVWIAIRSSFIAYSKDIRQENPLNILLFDKYLRVTQVADDMIRIFNATQILELRVKKGDVTHWIKEISRAKNSEWCACQSFDSSFPRRSKADVTWLVDGEDTFSSIADEILRARNVIMMQGWCITPELIIKKNDTQVVRFDELIKKKAEQGVKIYIIIYKEVPLTVNVNSGHAKMVFNLLHDNIKVIRFPDSIGGPLLWALHEKLIVIDDQVLFLGGIDMCQGRFDNSTHLPLDSTILESTRLPWHDVHCKLKGQVASDAARHFIQRWNYIRKKKINVNMQLLTPRPYRTRDALGTSNVQLLRSACKWSTGILEPENSIYNAYCSAISNAKHYIYIENQFFISSAGNRNVDMPVHNKIAQIIIDKIKNAHANRQSFKVYVMIPLVPVFESDTNTVESYSVRLIAQGQRSTISKGPHSIIGILNSLNIPYQDYIVFLSLRKAQLHNQKIVTQQIYVHSKLLIVDDCIAIIGSANINDRSLLGSRDTEIAAIITDDDLVPSRLNGTPVQVGKKVLDLRLKLWKEHWVLSDDSIFVDAADSNFFSDFVYQIAARNTEIFRNILQLVSQNSPYYAKDYNNTSPIRYSSQESLNSIGLKAINDEVDDTAKKSLVESLQGHVVLYPIDPIPKENILSASFLNLSLESLLPLHTFT